MGFSDSDMIFWMIWLSIIALSFSVLVSSASDTRILFRPLPVLDLSELSSFFAKPLELVAFEDFMPG